MTDAWPAIVEIAPGAVLVIDLIAQSQHPLLKEERLLVADATVARIREIHAGRTVARWAMNKCGILPGPILAGMGGEPVWPVGVCGSLTHTFSHVGALVARLNQYVSLGVDLDDSRDLGPTVAAEIAMPEELELIRRLDQSGIGSPSEPESVVFCAKEAIFKCQYSITHWSDLEFQDVHLHEGKPRGCLRVDAREYVPALVRETIRNISLKITNIQGVKVACAMIVANECLV